MARPAKYTVRVGVLFLLAYVVKLILESNKKSAPIGATPSSFTPTAPPVPARSESGPSRAQTGLDVAPIAEEEEPAPVTEPEPEPEPIVESEPIVEPEPIVEEPKPVKAKKVPVDKKATKKATGAVVAWVEPVGDVCPTTHPIKAKLGSKVYRKPDMAGYESSKPDRCYASEGAARRAGFNAAQR